MGLEISRVNVKDSAARKNLIEYLSKDESKALFLLGNLVNSLQPSELFLASVGGNPVGVCGYYPLFHSFSLYTQSNEVSNRFAQIASRNIPFVLLGMERMVRSAVNSLVQRGYKMSGGVKSFFQLSLEKFKPFSAEEGKICEVEARDVDAVVLLLRQLNGGSSKDPITAEERERVISCPEKYCMKVDGKVVSIASSNGLAIKAFQILGVVTDPEYQRHGFAKALCSHLISKMQSKGAKEAIVFTGEDNLPARKCYESLGFEITDRYCLIEFT